MESLLNTANNRSKSDQLLELVTKLLDDDKGQDISVIDLEGKSTIADHMVICSGTSSRHVGSMADHLVKEIKNAGLGPCKSEGLPQCDWVLLDGGDVIIHLFRPEVRDFYNLDKMWSMDNAEDGDNDNPDLPDDTNTTEKAVS